MLLLIVDGVEKMTWKLILPTGPGMTQHDFRYIWLVEKEESVTEGRFSELGQYIRMPSQEGGTEVPALPNLLSPCEWEA